MAHSVICFAVATTVGEKTAPKAMLNSPIVADVSLNIMETVCCSPPSLSTFSLAESIAALINAVFFSWSVNALALLPICFA